MFTSKRAKHAKSEDKRPARARYWVSGGLAFRKCRALVRSGYTPQAAIDYWEAARKRKKGDVPYRRILALRPCA